MNLATQYLGLMLRSPLVPSASPLLEDLGNIKRLEDAGAPAVVLNSLYEEQIQYEQYELHRTLDQGTESYPEALNYFPDPPEFKGDPETYLRHISQAKEAVGIPVIASLNGVGLSGWTRFAKQIEQAGAAALELNLYHIPTELNLPGADLEQQYVDVLKSVKKHVSIPVAVKLSPYFTNFAHAARRFDENGADGLVLFNRFYQPDIELETLEVTPNLLLSTHMAMRLPLRWIAILSGRVGCSLAATSGVHHGTDALKLLMAGADVTMLCSVLLRRGIPHLRVIEQELSAWMEEHEYESIEQLKGSMSQQNCPDPGAFERAQYMRALTTFKPK
jgi:dihydroorotate dehydrogenase (fumarate)